MTGGLLDKIGQAIVLLDPRRQVGREDQDWLHTLLIEIQEHEESTAAAALLLVTNPFRTAAFLFDADDRCIAVTANMCAEDYIGLLRADVRLAAWSVFAFKVGTELGADGMPVLAEFMLRGGGR